MKTPATAENEKGLWIRLCFFTIFGSGSKEKHRILPKLTPALWILADPCHKLFAVISHLWMTGYQP